MSDVMPIIPKRAGQVWAFIIVVIVIAPLLVIIAVSLSKAAFISFPWNEGFSLRWYGQIPHQTAFLTSAWNSVKLAVIAAVLSVAVGTCAAIAISRYHFRGRGIVGAVGFSPLLVPQVMTGLAILLALSAANVGTGFLTLLVGHLVITLPFVLRLSLTALSRTSNNLEQAAENLGATPLRAFWTVTGPVIRLGVTAGGIMAFIVSFENVSVSVFLSGVTYNVLPVYLYNYATNSFDGVAAAVSVALIGISVIAIVLLQRLVGLEKLFGSGA